MLKQLTRSPEISHPDRRAARGATYIAWRASKRRRCRTQLQQLQQFRIFRSRSIGAPESSTPETSETKALDTSPSPNQFKHQRSRRHPRRQTGASPRHQRYQRPPETSDSPALLASWATSVRLHCLPLPKVLQPPT